MTLPAKVQALREQWSQWSALLDEALDLDPAARAQWLAALALRNAGAAAAVESLLARETATPDTAKALLTTDGGGPKRQGFEGLLHTLLSRDDSTEAAVPGQTFGPWQVLRKLGSGGMGEVWLAARADRLYEGQAAIKLLHNSRDALRLSSRFARERQALARLTHPGIARLLDAGVAGEQTYLVLEYVCGRLLLDYAQTSAPMVVDRVRLALAIGRALEHAHAQLIVHRDIKPSNVMVTSSGEVKLLDFGIASLIDEAHIESTSLTRLYGRGLTLDYAAPEQITGEYTGVGTDVFSLGVLLFELLSGQRPFRASAPGRTALEYAVLHQPAQRLSQAARAPLLANTASGARPLDTSRLTAGLDAVVAKALQKSPADRYPTMAAFVADLERWLEHRPVLAAQRSRWRDSLLWLRRNRLVAVLSGAVMASLLAGLLATLLQSHRLMREGEKTAAVQGFLTSLLAAPNPWVQTRAEPTLRSVIDTGAARVDTEFAERPDIQLPLLLTLSDTYLNLGLYDSALASADKALALTTALRGLPDVTRAKLLHFKSRALFEKGQHKEGEALAREALRLQLKVFGPGNAESGETMMDLAAALSLQGQLSAAVLLSREALRILDRTRGPTHQITNLARYNHALILLRFGAVDEAIVESQKALATAVVLYSRDAGQAGCIKQRLGTLLLLKGRYAEAEPVLQQAITNLKATMPEQVFYAFALQSQARLLLETNRAAEALPLYRQALDIFRAAAGSNAPNVTYTELQLAEVMAALGEREAALSMARAAAAVLVNGLPNRQAVGANGLGVVLLRTGLVQEAITSLASGLALRQQIQPAGHYTIAVSAAWLALAHASAGDAEAAPQLEAAATHLARVFESTHFLRQRVAAAQRDFPPGS